MLLLAFGEDSAGARADVVLGGRMDADNNCCCDCRRYMRACLWVLASNLLAAVAGAAMVAVVRERTVEDDNPLATMRRTTRRR